MLPGIPRGGAYFEVSVVVGLKLHLERKISHAVTTASAKAIMLYLVGLGLSDETDITVKGLEVVKAASRVYLEAYTSILLVDQSVLVWAKDERQWLQRANADLQ